MSVNWREMIGGDVILRCELLRASKDDLSGICGHPSRLAEDGEHLRMTIVGVARVFAMGNDRLET